VSTDATVATCEFADITTAFTAVVQIAPIPPGRSYVFWATGHVALSHALVDIELEAFGAKDWIQHGSGGNDRGPFALVVGTTLPPDEDLFTVAKLSGRIRDDFASPGEPPATASITARLVMLAVDTLTVQGEQTSPFPG
jgi:hypothetical protein